MTHPLALYQEISQTIANIQGLNKTFKGFSSGQKAYDFLKTIAA